MTDITTIPIEELQADLATSKEDIAWCRTAIGAGILTYGTAVPESIPDRLAANLRVIGIIEAELARRQSVPVKETP
jgi:hypothetical protein